jgi:reverse gyrase
MHKGLILALALFSTAALAQVCDVTYSTDVETADGNNVLTSSTTVYGLPMADVLDNSQQGLQIIKMLGKADSKGGPYTIEVGEVRECDGKPPERVLANSIFAKGVTLADSNRISDKGLEVAKHILKRYQDRQAKGQRRGWDHAKAQKVKRNDLGQKQK